MSDLGLLDLAQKQVGIYTGQFDFVRDHAEAMESRDCEDFLRLAIQAFDWISAADARLRTMIAEGKRSFDPQVDDTLTALYEAWLTPCDYAEQKIQVQLDRGYRPENLDEFRRCCETARDLVEQRSLVRSARTASRAAAPATNEW